MNMLNATAFVGYGVTPGRAYVNDKMQHEFRCALSYCISF